MITLPLVANGWENSDLGEDSSYASANALLADGDPVIVGIDGDVPIYKGYERERCVKDASRIIVLINYWKDLSKMSVN